MLPPASNQRTLFWARTRSASNSRRSANPLAMLTRGEHGADRKRVADPRRQPEPRKDDQLRQHGDAVADDHVRDRLDQRHEPGLFHVALTFILRPVDTRLTHARIGVPEPP